MMRIVIADDMAEARNGIRKIIASHFPELSIDGEFEDGIQLMEYLETHTPDLLITDIRMPGFDGLAACKKLRECSDTAKIILITGYPEFEYAKEAIGHRVHALLTKPYARLEMAKVISTATGQPIHPTAISEPTAETHSKRMARKAKEYIRENYHNPNLSSNSIADFLNISPAYIGNMFYQEYGYKLSYYINQMRIRRAKELLADTLLSVHDISVQVGMTNIQSFNRIFKENVGMTPSDYRIRKLQP